jgi:hypothetical protein
MLEKRATRERSHGARHGDHCKLCMWPDDHDDWNARARGETPMQRVDRAYGEILQEVRVAQTGVQILFAFLLTLAFSAGFRTVTQFQRDIYVMTLMLCVAATALLIAPAAFHRIVYRRRLKRHLVQVASRLALAGLILLLLAVISALLLTLDVVTGMSPALFFAGGALAWFVTWWFVLPLWSRISHQVPAAAHDLHEEIRPGRPAPTQAIGTAQDIDRAPGRLVSEERSERDPCGEHVEVIPGPDVQAENHRGDGLDLEAAGLVGG